MIALETRWKHPEAGRRGEYPLVAQMRCLICGNASGHGIPFKAEGHRIEIHKDEVKRHWKDATLKLWKN